MASGFSKRMNREKLTLKIDDIPIVERVIKAVKSSNAKEVLVIYRNREVRKIAEENGVKAIYNPNAEKGQSEAMKLGIRSADSKAKGYMFCVGDQPFLVATTINQLIEAFDKEPQSITLPLYNGKRGNPVIFSVSFRDELLSTIGDQGGREIIKKEENKINSITIDDGNGGIDIDTWQQYEKFFGGDKVDEKKYCSD